MFKLNFKIAFRNFLKNFTNSLITIGGMAVAITAFLIIILYVKYEREYDASNPNYENIYLVGRNLTDNVSVLMSPEFAGKIIEVAPEVDLVGKIKYTDFEFPISSKTSRIYVKNVLSADFDAYKILNFQIDDQVASQGSNSERAFFLSESNVRTLFPSKKNHSAELVTIGSVAAGQGGKVQGTFKEQKHSNITFDGLAIAQDISAGMDSADYSYMTFIQVKPGTNIQSLTEKLNNLYISKAISRQEIQKPGTPLSAIFLDPLKNMHLHSRAGTDNGYRVVKVILYLGFLVLLLACLNFVNMSIAQSASRAREIGVKKVMGANKNSLVLQFITEIFIQCTISAVLGLGLAEFLLPVVNSAFHIELSMWAGDGGFFMLLILILLAVTLLAGLYPSLVLSSYKPALVLKGNFSNSTGNIWLKKALLIFQFSIAIAFIVGLLVVSRQLNYMQTQDRGFSTSQVIYIRNIMIFDKPEVFKPVKDRILQIDGVKSVSVTNQIPTGPKGPAQIFTVNGNDAYMNAVSIDLDYFKTLGIKLAKGRFFSAQFASDQTQAIILNETAVRKYNISNPLGKVMRNCNHVYQVIGIIKDFKADGFEKAVEPTVYSLSNVCGTPKTSILVKINEGNVGNVLATLKSGWAQTNKLDGEDFRYDFMDTLYGQLFKKQEQLQFVFRWLSFITILVALFGLYAYAKFVTNSRLKEIAIRKILGANNFEIFILLNRYFFWLIILSNLIAAPVVYIAAARWLESFAYKEAISISPFLITALITISLTIVTVLIQAAKAIKSKPAIALKYE